MSVRVLTAAVIVALVSTSVALASPVSTAEVDRDRVVEFNSIFAGTVMGYTASDRQVRMDMPMAKGHMQEGMRCGMGHHSGCGCQPTCCWREGWYDCWGVWQPDWDDMDDFAAIRESDYDPVMGDHEYGRSWWW